MSTWVKCARRWLLSVGALLVLVVASAAGVSAQTDVIRGRVTDSDGRALAGVRVTATSIPGNVTRSVNTNAQGQFQIAFPGGPGDYIMGYALVRLRLPAVRGEAAGR